MKNYAIVLAFATVLSIAPGSLDADEIHVNAAAVEGLFSPQRAPMAKTMGLYQRSFVDLMETARNKLQVAVVIDGTISMGGDLVQLKSALTRMVNDLRLYKGTDVSFQLVVYRDTGVAPRHIELPLNISENRFTADQELLSKAIDSIEALSGAPYFPELIDLGIHTAIKQLSWDQADTTERWLIVFGDAPPYDEGFVEEKTKARREIWTQELSAAAQTAGIRINCVLCTSSSDQYEVAKQVRRKTQNFMATLANDTGGKMLDLTYDNIRKEIEKAAAKPLVGYTDIGKITRRDVDLVRQQAVKEERPEASNRRVTVAVLPHVPLSKVSFDPKLPEVQVAADLALKLRNVQGLSVKSSTAVERQLNYLRRRGTEPETLIQTLMTRLNVDYVVWGSIKPSQGVTKVSTAFYSRNTGGQLTEPVVFIKKQDSLSSKDTAELAEQLLTRASLNRGKRASDRSLRNNLVAFANNGLKLTPTSASNQIDNPLLAGFIALERALEYDSADPETPAQLESAEKRLTEAIQGPDANDAFANYLLASCYLNQAQACSSAGMEQQAKAKSNSYLRALNRARRALRDASTTELKREILGDYELLSRKNPAAAIEHYEALLDSPKTNLHSAARAHWMLAGIYAGDWNVDKSIVDPEKAKQHVVQILAHWEDSPYAQFFKRALDWDESTGETRLGHLQKANQTVAAAIGDIDS